MEKLKKTPKNLISTVSVDIRVLWSYDDIVSTFGFCQVHLSRGSFLRIAGWRVGVFGKPSLNAIYLVQLPVFQGSPKVKFFKMFFNKIAMLLKIWPFPFKTVKTSLNPQKLISPCMIPTLKSIEYCNSFFELKIFVSNTF